MIEKIGGSLQAARAPVQVERPEVPPPQEVKTPAESKDLSQVQYYSPVIKLDVDTQAAILQYRDGMTGEVTREFGREETKPQSPPDQRGRAATDAYQAAFGTADAAGPILTQRQSEGRARAEAARPPPEQPAPPPQQASAPAEQPEPVAREKVELVA